MAKLEQVVESLTKGKMGARGSDGDNQNILLGLEEFARSQRQRGMMLVVILLVLLLAPIAITQLNIPTNLYPYLLGASGLFAAGTVKMVLGAYQDLSRAHTLIILCQQLESADARQILLAWLKGK